MADDLVAEQHVIRCPLHNIPDCSPLLNGCSEVLYEVERRKGDGLRRVDAEGNSPPVAAGDVVTFDGKRTRWLARAHSEDGRYTLLTAPMFGNVFYSIIDWQRSMRGPMNVIGWGLGIDTAAGPDEQIDQAMKMLRPWPPLAEGEVRVLSDVEDGPRGFELSRRGEIPLNITTIDKRLVPVQRPNGKWYLPEKPPAQVEFMDLHQETGYVAVLRTHDLELARSVARPVFTAHLVTPEGGRQLIWLHQTMRDGQPWWEYDEGRGVPAVLFEESDEPEGENDD